MCVCVCVCVCVINAATMLAYTQNKKLRQIFETTSISLCRNVYNRPGFIIISPYLEKLILNTYNTSHL